MSLTVDYITMPPKSQEVSQIQQTDSIKQQVEQQQVAVGFEQNVQKETKTTVARKNVDNDELKNDNKDGGKGRYQKKGKKNSSSKDEKKKLNPIEGGLFDIKI